MLFKNTKNNSFCCEEDYPDDFESYNSEESTHSDNNETLDLIDLKKKPEPLPKKNEINNEIDFGFENELNYLIEKQTETKKIMEKEKHKDLQNFHIPRLECRFHENIDEWIEKQTQELQLSPVSRRSIPYSYFKSPSQRSASPSEFSCNFNRKFNCNNPRPTLCDKPIMFSKSTQPPSVTANSWAIMNGYTEQLIIGRNLNKKREIASLTKIMTALVVCQLVERMKICPYSTYLQISKKNSSYQGTSADLLEGDILTIWDLLHGMMLPSGNDAASCLSENFGIFLYYECFERKVGKKSDFKTLPKKGCLSYFIEEMNECAKKLKLKNTLYANAHGLANDLNKSTVVDLCKLSSIAMKNEMIRLIVKKKTYNIFIKNKFGNDRDIEWINLNRILDINGFIGLKTGVTVPAGACLSSVYKDNKFFFIFVVLGCDSKDERFEDTEKLLHWIKNKLNQSFIKL